ncbi:hypothetical protein SAMN05444156_0943 [Verrucomicrobium sp. GAS474]|uniref:hypothetical protein n=1 Tax=Verrucomicrobium sp. GAS474 TaxID=1882831 RepID=UPI00087AB494|nr:hypothetical protein [Verrucomicrobium sp. GAS474]SDT94319.1 hypothetical protein SAMN05444156_0943 [Verrucomicrobium sp. GAS474]
METSHRDDAIRAGDIRRTTWPAPGEKRLPLYQGSGRSGACWNAWGLMDSPGDAPPDRPNGQLTVWSHADYWHRGPFGLDAWLHLGWLGWAGNPPAVPRRYEQILSLLDGCLTTHAEGPQGSHTLRSYFDPGQPDLLTIEIDYDFPAGFPSLRFEPLLEQKRGYAGPLSGSARHLEEASHFHLLRLEVGTARSHVALRLFDLEGTASLAADSRGVGIHFSSRKGRHLLVLGAAGVDRGASLQETLFAIDPEQRRAEAARHWLKRWGAGRLRVPDPDAQALWARSHFYLLSSYGPDLRAPAPPMGWTGAAWPYGFPQDLSYVHPALLRLGHLDIARAWVEFYARTLPSMQEATRRIYGAEGAMWAWEYPIGETSRILADGSPNAYQYEIHNAAYPARMAYETALHLNDPAWSRQVAWEVVRESARFYASALRLAGDGLWDLRVTPSMGQDELDHAGGGNYLCSLFSARYTLQAALRLAACLRVEDGEIRLWRRILADGLPFARLLDPATGLYATREGIDAASHLGRQKHPVQLNPLFCLPLGEVDGPTRIAARRRRDLCVGLGTRSSQGWTVNACGLAAVHAGDGAGFLSDLRLAASDLNIDPEWIQIYECASAHKPYFITSHGLYLQAIQDALVSDFFGTPRFGAACPPEWREASFEGLRTSDGRVWSGTRSEGHWTAIDESL